MGVYVGFLKLNFNIYYELNKKPTYTPCYVLVKKIKIIMKHILRFNESIRDEVRDEISSSFKASGNLIKHEQDIKNDILSFIDQLLDDEIESIHQMAQLKKGEISQEDVDVSKLMEMGQKLNKELMNIVKKYNKF